MSVACFCVPEPGISANAEKKINTRQHKLFGILEAMLGPEELITYEPGPSGRT